MLSKNLIEFSLDIFVTMSTLDSFDRRSNTFFCYTLKGIWYMGKDITLDIAINYVC